MRRQVLDPQQLVWLRPPGWQQGQEEQALVQQKQHMMCRST
jgi:hypothetical protein